jgi:hypothetical protein
MINPKSKKVRQQAKAAKQAKTSNLIKAGTFITKCTTEGIQDASDR